MKKRRLSANRMRMVFSILTFALLSLLLEADSALAVACTQSPPDWNYAIEAGPGVGITSANGVHGSATIKDGYHLESNGGMHVESIYLWNDYSNAIEYGWKEEASGAFGSGPEVFDLMFVDGVAFSPRIDDGSPTTTNHSFRTTWGTGSGGRFNFEYDGVQQTYHRDPIWNFGRPNAASEVSNQCDYGLAHWWGLKRVPTVGGTWVNWDNTHMICDGETDYGYQQDSMTEFHVVDVANTNTTGTSCDPFA